MNVHLQKKLPDRPYLIIRVHPINLLHIPKPRRILRHAARQRGVHPPRRDHVIAGDVLDPLKLIFGRNVPHRNDLIRLPLRRFTDS